jgi:hypothetical protein
MLSETGLLSIAYDTVPVADIAFSNVAILAGIPRVET